MKIRLIVSNEPTKYGFGQSPVELYGMAIADIAGGFTASQATGGWTDGDGELIVEPVTVFDCTVPNTSPFHKPSEWRAKVKYDFVELATLIAGELLQVRVIHGNEGIKRVCHKNDAPAFTAVFFTGAVHLDDLLIVLRLKMIGRGGGQFVLAPETTDLENVFPPVPYAENIRGLFSARGDQL